MSVSTFSTYALAQDHQKVFELRTYTATPGNLDVLVTLMRDHGMQAIEKYGMTNIGYWIPTDEASSNNTLIYIVEHKTLEDAGKSWQAFSKDPEWQKAYAASKANGPILEKVARRYMSATEFSPMQ